MKRSSSSCADTSLTRRSRSTGTGPWWPPTGRSHRSSHALQRVERQAHASGDATLAALVEELAAYPAPAGADLEPSGEPAPLADVVVPFSLRTDIGVLSFFSTTTVFGSPVDVTLSELAIEAFFPADTATAQALRSYDAARS